MSAAEWILWAAIALAIGTLFAYGKELGKEAKKARAKIKIWLHSNDRG